MTDYEHAIRLPEEHSEYQAQAFFDDADPSDLPDLHIRTGRTMTFAGTGYKTFQCDGSTIIRMNLDWDAEHARQFWQTLRDTCDKALARVDLVERVEQAAK